MKSLESERLFWNIAKGAAAATGIALLCLNHPGSAAVLSTLTLVLDSAPRMGKWVSKSK